jgi:hypothetical protein
MAKTKARGADAPASDAPVAARKTLRPVEILALKALSGSVADKVRDDVSAGDHPVDLTIHFKGKLYVAANGETPDKTKPDLAVLAVLFLQAIPEEAREPFLRKLRSDHDKLERFPLPDPAVAKRLETFIEDLTVTKMKPKRGAVTAMIETTVIT